MHHLWPKSSQNDLQSTSFWWFLVGRWDSWKSMFYYSKTSIFKVLGGPVSRLLRYIFHGINFFTFYLIFLRFLAENVLKWVPGGGPKILKFHQKSCHWSQRVPLGSPGEPKVTKMEPKATKMEPKVTKMTPRGLQNDPKWMLQWAQRTVPPNITTPQHHNTTHKTHNLTTRQSPHTDPGTVAGLPAGLLDIYYLITVPGTPTDETQLTNGPKQLGVRTDDWRMPPSRMS